jgi:hypothetical protein
MNSNTRPRREALDRAGFVAGLTANVGAWLEQPPQKDEQQRILTARRALQQHRAEAEALAADSEAANRFSLDVFRDERFAPLHFDDWVIEQVLAELGEPPIVEDDSDPAFSNYLRDAVQRIAGSRVRRAMAEQVIRFIPGYIEAGQVREALAIEQNAYMTVMSEAITPLLVQMLVGGLARWYDEHEPDDEPTISSDT